MAMIPRWYAKLALQSAMSVLPRSHQLNYLFQSRVTRSLPPSGAVLEAKAASAAAHLEVFRSAYGRYPTGDDLFLEFGAGWHLAIPISFALQGVRRQLVLDLNHLALPTLVSDSASRLAAAAGVAPPADPLRDLGIEYRAPADARTTGLDAEAVSFVSTTSVLEHVPPDDLRAIMTELHRVLRADGIASFVIDHRDHWSYFDRTISRMNFLRYDERAWRLRNPDLHYQNRLRHRDFVDIFEETGFVVNEARTPAADSTLAAFVAANGSPQFSANPAQSAIEETHFVLTRHGP